MYYPYGFEKNVIAHSATPMPSGEITYQIYHSNTQEIQKDENGFYKINQDAVERSTLSKTIVSKIFGSSLGLNDLCFHNINSTYYFLNYGTNADVGIRFNFNGNPIDVYSENQTCMLISSNTNFIVVLNQGVLPKVPPDIILKNLYADKSFQRYVDEKNLDINTGQLLPSIFTEVYVQPSLITLVVAFLIIFIVWSGFVFLCRDLRDFIR